jgi:hypothetical protein
MLRCLVALCAAVVFATCSSHLQAQVIAWESFDDPAYTVGSNLNGGAAGVGWSTVWSSTSSGAGPIADVTIQAPAMLPPYGGTQAARIQLGASVAGDNNQVMRRDIASFSGNAAVADNPVYFAVLLRHNFGANDDFLQIQLSDGSVGNAANTLSMGLHNSSSSKPLFARVGTSSAGATTTTVAAPPGTDQLLIGRLSKVGGQFERIDMFVNQFSEGVANATAIDNEPSLAAISRFNIRLNNIESSDIAFIDQIAIAGTFDQLFPQLTTTPNSSGNAVFGNTRVGTTSSQTITAENTGSFTLTALNFGAPSNALFSRVGAAAGSNLITAATDSRTYNFSPTARGAASGSVTVSGDRGTPGADANKVVNSTVNLTATAVGPVLGFTINDFDPSPRSGTPLASGGNNGNVALATGETINVGEAGWVNPPETSTALLTLSNVTPDGDLGSLTDLTILSGVISGPDGAQFQLLESDGVTPYTGGDVLAAGQTLDLVVQFAADGATPDGLKSALLTINTDQGAALGSAGGAFTFNLQAVQTPEPASLLLWTMLGGLTCAAAIKRRPGMRRSK